MYNAYFGFEQSPFDNTLDQRFLFLSQVHQEVLAALRNFAEVKNGFAVVCGEVGTGKTMMISSFVEKLPESVQPIIMLTPYVTSLDILIHIAKVLKIRIAKNDGVLRLTEKVTKALTAAKLKEKSFVLIIDEAHLLSDQALTEIGLLSNLETSDQKLLPILLVGQDGLSHRLDSPEMRHLQRRITVKRFLAPLTPEETLQYVDYRLRQAGSSLASVFENKCRKLIFKMTQGYPPLINQLCDNSLLICMAEEMRKVNVKILKKAHEAWQTDLVFTPKSSKTLTYRVHKPNKSLMLAAGGLAVVALLGFAAIHSGFSVDNLKSVFEKIRSAVQTAAAPQAPTVAQRDDLQRPEKESLPLKQSSQLKGAPASPVGPLVAAPAPSVLPKGFGRAEIAGELSSGEKQSLPSPGKGDLKPETPEGPKVAAKTPADQEALGPQEARQQVGKGPGHSQGAAVARTTPASNELITQAGDTLSRIVNRRYPDDKKLGLVALLLANPELNSENKVKPGQALYLPEINPEKGTIRLQDQKYYSVFGRYVSAWSLKKDSSWLANQQVPFVVRVTKDSRRNRVQRVYVGGYGTEAELEHALQGVNLGPGTGKNVGRTKQSVGRLNHQEDALPAGVSNKHEATADTNITQTHHRKELRDDPEKSNLNGHIKGAFNKFAVDGQTNQASGFDDTQKNLHSFSTQGNLVALSEAQLQQVTTENRIRFHKVHSESKIDNSFNGFAGLGRANQSTGSINSQENFFSVAGGK
jgi:type II secretory pathway predicted ATPase ExeA